MGPFQTTTFSDIASDPGESAVVGGRKVRRVICSSSLSFMHKSPLAQSVEPEQRFVSAISGRRTSSAEMQRSVVEVLEVAISVAMKQANSAGCS